MHLDIVQVRGLHQVRVWLRAHRLRRNGRNERFQYWATADSLTAKAGRIAAHWINHLGGYPLRNPRSISVLKMSLAATVACLSVLLIGAAHADDYPSHTVNIVVPYPAGGGVDAMARMIAEKLSTSLKGQFVVDNRGGGGGNIGMRAAARAQPDGYTLLLGHTGTMAINPNLYDNPGYDPKKDFAPLGLVATFPVALLAHPSFPAKTLKEAIDLA